MTVSRRSVLEAGVSGLTLATLAGCLSEPGEGTAPEGGYAAFFALWDWAEAVTGEEMAIENPVDAGEIGHGWEPTADLQRDIAGSNAFIYLDTAEFAWAQNIAADLETDTDVALIDGMAGLESQLLPAGGHADDGHEHADDDGHGHDDGLEYADPHVWTDPVLVQDIVETIAEGIAAVDPDNEAIYEENAAAYIDRLEDVDRQFEELAADASRDLAVLAGHDSFQYIEHRYDFELHTPVGVSPDAAETESDISETIEIVEDHDIDTILYDPFETPSSDDVPQMVELLLENTSADDYVPLASTEGTTQEWNERGWGWIDQMENVNLPSLRQALGAE